VVLWDALKGLVAAKSERFEFEYNIARLSTTTLFNVQLAKEDRVLPSELWPDWGAKLDPDNKTQIDPEKLAETTRAQIEYLKNM